MHVQFSSPKNRIVVRMFSGKVFGMREEVVEFTKEDHKESVEVEEAHGEVLEIPVELLAQMRTAVKAGGAPVEASQQLRCNLASRLQAQPLIPHPLSLTLYPLPSIAECCGLTTNPLMLSSQLPQFLWLRQLTSVGNHCIASPSARS